MSVELTLYAGVYHDSWRDGWLDPLATLEIVAWGYDSGLYHLEPAPQTPTLFLYGTGGDTQIHKDKYGKQLYGFMIERVIETMEKDAPDGYWALTCLKELKAHYADGPWGKRLRVTLFFH